MSSSSGWTLRWIAMGLLASALAACASDDSNNPSAGSGGAAAAAGSAGAAGDAAGATGGAGTGGGAGAGGAGAGATGGAGGDTAIDFGVDDASGITDLLDCALAREGACVRPIARSHDEVCTRWLADYPEQAQAAFLSRSSECDPGEVDPDAIDDGLRRLNLYRWLLGHEPLPIDASWSEAARACAIIQAYIGPEISHYPEPDSPCYTELGYTTSGESQLAFNSVTPAAAIDSLIFDSGDNNAHKLGHRHGLLDPGAMRVGIGFTEVAEVGSYATCVRSFSDADMIAFAARAEGVDGVVMYPPPGHFPYEPTSWAINGYPRGAEYYDRQLQWSLQVSIGDTALAGASVRVYRQLATSLEPITLEYGPLDDPFSGLWLVPETELEPGTYVVIVEGSALGAFGYRTILEPCGVRVPLVCDALAQDCGDASLGCYGTEDAFCAPSAGIAIGEPCGRISECVPGAECSSLIASGAGGGFACAAYCDPLDASAANACETLCPGNWAEAVGSDLQMLPIALCIAGAGGSCDPLAQDCGDGNGCYGRESTGCLPAGNIAAGEECTPFGGVCVPGFECIGVLDQPSYCQPYCDPAPTAAGANACATLCANGFWELGENALCIPDP